MAGYHYHRNFYLWFLVSPDNTQLLSGHCYMSFILVSYFVTVHSYRKKNKKTKKKKKIFGFLVRKQKGVIFQRKRGRTTFEWNYGISTKKILIKKVFHLTHKVSIEETKEVLRKLGRLSLPLPSLVLWNCVIQNTPLRGHRNRVKNDAELAESDGNIMT